MTKIIQIEDDHDFRDLTKIALDKFRDLELIQFSDLESFDKSFRSLDASLYIFDGQFPSNSISAPVYNWHNAAKLVTEFNPNSKILILSGDPPSRSEWENYNCVKEVYSKNGFKFGSFRDFVRPYLQ